MADRYAVFVDSSFLRSEGAKRLGMQPARSEIAPRALVEYFTTLWKRDEQLLQRDEQLLRVYWYDGQYPSTHPASGAQRKYLDQVALTPAVTLRLGVIKSVMPSWLRSLSRRLEREGFAGSADIRPLDVQKGVDTLIALDLVRLAQKRAYTTAVLVAGDRDLVEAVTTGQDEGRVIVLAFPDGTGVDRELLRSADAVHVIAERSLRQIVRPRQLPTLSPDDRVGEPVETVDVLCPTEDCGATVKVRIVREAGASAVPICPNCGKNFHVHRRGDLSVITREWGYTKEGAASEPTP